MMDNFKQECKLCDNFIVDKNFKVIEDVAKDIFDIPLLKLTLNDTPNVMCTMCSSKLLDALNFKKTCLYTHNSIKPYVDFKNPKPDLKQIYAKEKGSKQGGGSSDDRDVCRLCLEPVSGDHKSIEEVPVGSIEIYIPEINFEATTNHVICIKCHDALHVHSTFIKNCLDVDKKRNGDSVKGQAIFFYDQSIKTEEIEIKSEETYEETLFETVYIKKEEHDEGDTSLRSQIELMHTEESKSLYELDHLEQTSAQATFENAQANECSFKTISESRSADQEGQHKRISEAQGNESDCSNRNSKRRCLTRDLIVQEYQCDKCTYNTKNKVIFMQHQLFHKGSSKVQMYECDECQYRSIQKSHLTRHQLTHKDISEVRVFRCDECDYKSIHKAHLKHHQLTHKDPAELKMFKCDRCKFETKYRSNFVSHSLKHRDPSEVQMYECDECKFITNHKRYLIAHYLTHKDPAEVQMYTCDKCTYTAKRRRNLIRHSLTHKERQEFKCDECDFQSKKKSQFERHQLTHTNPS